MYFVIGSGPAGVACAYALAQAGHKVTILDVGLTLDADRDAVRASVALRDKEAWTQGETALLRSGPAMTGGVPLKLVHGSDHPYRTVPGTTDIHYSDLNIRASYALGGLSNVWGGTMLPYRQEDIADWPISLQDLSVSYAEILKFVPLAAKDDDLSSLYPLYTDTCGELRSSSQITKLMRALKIIARR